MKRLLTIILLFVSGYTLAQTDTTITFLSSNGKKLKSIGKATFITKSYQSDSASWVKNTMSMNAKMVRLETFMDKDFSRLNGRYVEYENGKTSLKGRFIDGKKVGLWIAYDSLSRATEVKNYMLSLLHGPYKSYWENGNVKEDGNYSAGKQIGEWKLFYNNGNVADTEIYNEEGKLTDSSYLDINGKTTVKENVKTLPKYPGGNESFYKFFSQNFRFPSRFVVSGINLELICSFTITKTGTIENITVKPANYPELTDEVIRVLKSSPKWTPSNMFGAPISSSFNMPIKLWTSSSSEMRNR